MVSGLPHPKWRQLTNCVMEGHAWHHMGPHSEVMSWPSDLSVQKSESTCLPPKMRVCSACILGLQADTCSFPVRLYNSIQPTFQAGPPPSWAGPHGLCLTTSGEKGTICLPSVPIVFLEVLRSPGILEPLFHTGGKSEGQNQEETVA